jgi:hypothetical protein
MNQSDDRLIRVQRTQWNPFPGHPTELVALRAQQAVHARPDRPAEQPDRPREEDERNALTRLTREQPVRKQLAARTTPAWVAILAPLSALAALVVGALNRGVARSLPHLWAAARPEIAPACRDPGFSTRPMKEPLDHALLRAPWLGWWS